MTEQNKTTEENSKIDAEIKYQLEMQFRRGMYTVAYGLSGAIRNMITDFRKIPKKKLVDYNKLISDIDRLCRTDLINPDKKETE